MPTSSTSNRRRSSPLLDIFHRRQERRTRLGLPCPVTQPDAGTLLPSGSTTSDRFYKICPLLYSIFTPASMYAQAATIRALSPDALEISYSRPLTNKTLSQSTARKQQLGPSFAARSGRGHIPQLSITDDTHHVTEAIGGMYDDEEEHEGRNESRNYTPPITNRGRNARHDVQERTSARGSLNRKQLPQRNMSNGGTSPDTNTYMRPSGGRSGSWEQDNGQTSPTLGMRERAPSDTATTHFPLADIDYESSPAAVAQELSNLHALRRMSMDVAAQGDPDLPSLSPAGMPSAPSHSDSEDDSARLFWVPARLHPELAPQEFKTFLNSKAEQIKRRSGELSQFSTSPSSSRSSSLSVGGGGLSRKKSMLSRQIDSPVGYQDGAERLGRKRSSGRNGQADPNLEELESLVSEGSVLQRLSLESPLAGENGDIILPSVPGNSLKRSTRTTYNRGGSRTGRADRTTYAQRAARRTVGAGDQVSPHSPKTPDVPPLPSFSPEIANLASTLKDPSANSRSTTNFSRPGKSPSPPPSISGTSIGTTFDDILAKDDGLTRSSISSIPSSFDRKTPSTYRERPNVSLPQERQEIPQIVEIPPPDEALSRASTAPTPPPQAYMQYATPLPERTSSRESPRDDARTPSPGRPGMPPRQGSPVLSHKRPPSRGGNVSSSPQQSRPAQSLEQMSSHPSPLPGNDTNTSNLSFIPTLTEDKRADNRKIKDKKEDGKKSGWGWLLGKEDAEKEKKQEGGSSKPKAKITKPPEKHDNTRLDVLQSSIDGGSGKSRESLVLDRDSLKLEEERKKESQRKSVGSDTKKEKEGLFSSFFGGGKKGKAEKESTTRKHHSRGLSPEPPYKELKPDIDYNWTRFSILEERAIYRMAHIKLANPRRALYSQVLLSNFMYSYLAKVQQMHPQMNLPTSAKAQKKQQQSQAQPKQQPDEFTQYQRYQQVC